MKKRVRGLTLPSPRCEKCNLILDGEKQKTSKDCPRCSWKGYDYKNYRKRFTFAQAQEILKNATKTDLPLWHDIRERAVKHLLERGSEEIGSSDVSCVAIEFIQNESLVIENGKIIKDETGF